MNRGFSPTDAMASDCDGIFVFNDDELLMNIRKDIEEAEKRFWAKHNMEVPGCGVRKRQLERMRKKNAEQTKTEDL